MWALARPARLLPAFQVYVWTFIAIKSFFRIAHVCGHQNGLGECNEFSAFRVFYCRELSANAVLILADDVIQLFWYDGIHTLIHQKICSTINNLNFVIFWNDLRSQIVVWNFIFEESMWIWSPNLSNFRHNLASHIGNFPSKLHQINKKVAGCVCKSSDIL